MISWELRALVDIGDLLLVDGLWVPEPVPELSEIKLWAASGATGGIGALGLNAGQSAVMSEPIWIGEPKAPFVFADVDVLGEGGNIRFLVSGGFTGALTLMHGDGAGQVVPQGSVLDMAGQPLMLSQLVTFEMSQTRFMVATPASGAAELTLFEMEADLRHAGKRGSVLDTEKMTLAGVSDLIHLTVDGQDFIVASSSAEDGLSSFAVSDAGIELRDTLGPKDGLWIDGLEDVAALMVAGQSFIVGVSAGSNTLSAVRLNPMGAMFVTDMAMDDRDSRFAGAVALDTFQTEGRGFIVTGGTDDGLALFELIPGGTLYHHQSLAQSGDWNIGHILSVEAVALGDEVQVLMTGAKGKGVAQMVLPLQDMGALQTGTQQGDSMTGGAGDDLLMGLGGDDHLSGGGGADVLIAGIGHDTLTGGAGADTFVFTTDGQADTITDFQPGQDRINLDDWGMIYDISALNIRPTSWGATLSWRNEVLHVYSADDTRLDSDMWSMDDFLF